ncbi:MAG: YgeY family selenium metabolism-linked hydrolase [Caldilineaceae bacterium]|nr:YgeY family selenium metabolism-linked hydrolase [Caldilineaceae bacterium]
MLDTDRLTTFARDIVRIPSLSGEEAQVAGRIEAEMKALAFDSVWTDDVGNVIGVLEGAQPGPTIVFDAHTDTVGVSPGVPWALDPYSGRVTRDSLHGRGAADMKGALAAMVYGINALDKAELKGKAVVSASVMEEVLEGVALEKVIAQTGADFVVIGEASNLQLVRGGRGRAEIHLTTTGRPSHSSAPQMGRNAVLDMMQVIAAVEDLALDEHPQMGPAIFALTDIISEPYPGHSVIPSICRVTYDRRLLPGESAANVLADIRQRPELADIKLDARVGLGEYTSYTGHTFTTEKFFPAWLADDNDPFVTVSLAALHGVGIQAGLNAYRFCTNAAFSAGVAGIPTIGFGPATEADAHIINEKLKLEDLIAAARGYRAIGESILT